LIYNLFDDGGRTFIGWLLLECLSGEKLEEIFQLPTPDYIKTMSELEIEIKINGQEVDFVDVIKQIEAQMDRIVLKKTKELIDCKLYQLEEARRKFEDKIHTIMGTYNIEE
jgi:hypothetical protein